MAANQITVEAEPFIPYVSKENMPKQLMPVLEPYEKRMGFVPNALKLYAHRPEIAETLWRLNSTPRPSSGFGRLCSRPRRISLPLSAVTNALVTCSRSAT